jgi:hypothetical protein
MALQWLHLLEKSNKLQHIKSYEQFDLLEQQVKKEKDFLCLAKLVKPLSESKDLT